MKLVFVMDIMNGLVVLAERGERQNYRPVAEKSLIVKESDPFKVLEFIKPRFLYVADLDRITGKGENTEILKSISPMVEEMIADCGFRSPEELEQVNFIPVLGTETFDITRISEIDRDCYVSFDFRENLFLDASERFGDFRNAVDFLNSFSVRGIIVLNIARVGSGKADFRLLEEFLSLSEHPVYLGGGVSDLRDLEILKDLGCAGVLLSTAVHKKRVALDLIQSGFI
ncbi:MAG: phosphoribosylformimino-5-aminoimidazole carboxamide ribotide isomerase [Archaeoglobaceae archaeon]|nr:phosphoribosylformimino-5-aminoimidazole carboxamide ribotide isomerase [Archaeoglobaceae archaeon]